MKKQFLILTFLSLAFVFAGLNQSFGQYANYVEGTPECTPAIPLTCIDGADALHPLPGVVYTYSITTDPEAVQSVHWFVTDVADVIAVQNALTGTIDPAPGDYVLTAPLASYNVPANTAKTIDISWKSFDGATNQVLLVAYVTGADGCTDNIEVYRIEPEFGFTVDVAGMFDNGALAKDAGGAVLPNDAWECVSPVESANYNGTSLTVDYGENWVFFSVNAANFVDSWEPTITATYSGLSTIAPTDIQWAYPDQAILNDPVTGLSTGIWNASGIPVEAQVAGGAVGAAGECIVVRVRVDHAGNELDGVVTLSINGVMSDPAAVGTATEYTNIAYKDLNEPTTVGATACETDIPNTADYTLTPRPYIDSTTPDPATIDFEPKNP